MSDAPKFKTFKDLKSIPPASNKPKLEAVQPAQSNPSITSNTSNATLSSNTSKRSNTSKPRDTSITSNGERSVSRDFQKVPNSVTRQFLAQGIFTGKSKQVWDYLWSVSRGAINPSRFVRKSRPEIKKGSGLGSFVTVDKSIKHLEDVGLLKKIELTGSHDGNKFEIFTPEEALSLTSITSNTGNTSYTQKLDILVLPESSNTSMAQTPINIEQNADPKTSFKDNIKPDDEAFAILNEKLSAAVVKLTGKTPSARDAEKWGTLADLLILELEIAARRAGSVSSVPAFLTEVLRRQFFTARQEQKGSSKSSKVKPDTVGRSDSEQFEIKPLDEQGREAALEELREFANEDFLEDFKKWYTEEDWQWLRESLEVSKTAQ